MPQRLSNRLMFRLERLILRGPQYRLLIIAALIGVISIVAGAIIHYVDPNVERDFGDAVWWAFLRLSDPGYLGDDTGGVQRTVSTVLTVLGYVVFLGSLVAIMTQWLNERMAELEAGLTPIAQQNHVLIIGWTNRTATIVRELVLSSGRVRRFLRRRGVRTLRIAVLADEVTTALSIELRDRLGKLWNERQVILRSGSALRIEHLRRVDFAHAAVVILPAADFAQDGPDQADTRAIKTLLSMTNHPAADPSSLPLAVAEIFDSRKIDIARRAYGGSIEILASDSIIGRLIAQNVRHPGLSHVYGELLTHGRGNEIYIRECSDFEGRRVHDVAPAFPRAILLGLVRPQGPSFRPLLNPAPGTTIQADDRLVLLAHSFKATEAGALDVAESTGPESRAAALSTDSSSQTPTAAPARRLRVLVLGWSHKVPALLREFDSYEDEDFDIDVVSSSAVTLREDVLQRHDFTPRRIVTRQIQGDYTTPSVLHRIDVNGYDNIVVLGSDRFDSGEESDARTIVAYLLLQELLPAAGGPNVLIELLDAANISLFRRRTGEVIISPVVLSHMLAQVALRRELRAVFDELFGPGGAEIVFRQPAYYGLQDRRVTFAELERAAAARGETALGVRVRETLTGGGGVALTPARDRSFEPADLDEVIVLTEAP